MKSWMWVALAGVAAAAVYFLFIRKAGAASGAGMSEGGGGIGSVTSGLTLQADPTIEKKESGGGFGGGKKAFEIGGTPGNPLAGAGRSVQKALSGLTIPRFNDSGSTFSEPRPAPTLAMTSNKTFGLSGFTAASLAQEQPAGATQTTDSFSTAPRSLLGGGLRFS